MESFLRYHCCMTKQKQTITDADYADDIAILANTPNQAETRLHSLERAARRHRPLCQCTQNGIYAL